MRALSDQGLFQAEAHDAAPHIRALPKPARLAIRFAHRFLRGDVAVGRHTGKAAAAAFLAATAAYGAHLGGRVPGILAATSQSAGLTIESVRITGHQRTTQDDVLAALQFGDTPTIIDLDVNAARERLLALPWVATAGVAKALPGSVSVELTEKRAAAIWQSGSDIQVLDENGTPIGPARLAADRSLPAFVGKGADKTGLAFAALVKAAAPTIAGDVSAHVRVADRRWDLLMANGVTVRLPEDRPEQALFDLELLQAEHDILGRDVTIIDLRIAGRTTLALGETALAQLFPAGGDAAAPAKVQQ